MPTERERGYIPNMGNTREAVSYLINVGIVLFIVIVLSIAWVINAKSEEHDHSVMPPAVAQFLETWRRPPEREMSCCNKQDCYPTQITQKDGVWFYLHRQTQKWIRIPDHLLEENTKDPKDSPDGQSWVCATDVMREPGDPGDGSSITTYCAVRGAGG